MPHTRVIHLSDLHLAPGAPEVDVARRVVDDVLERTDAGALVAITGDITDHPDPDEYAVASDVLAPLFEARRVLVVPGNHDVEHAGTLGGVTRTPYLSWAEHHLGVRPTYPYQIEQDGVRLIGLDSTAAAGGIEDLARGRLGDDQLEALDEYLALAVDVRVVCLHHQPYYRDFGLDLADRVALTERTYDVADLILCGHEHRSAIYRRRGATWGTVAAPKTTAGGEYRLIQIDPDGGVGVEVVGC